MTTYSIQWTVEAEQTFHQNIEYLAKEWELNVLNQFLDRVDAVIENIATNPFLYPLHARGSDFRKCVVNERIILYYCILNDECVSLISFWNTYRDTRKLPF